MSDKQRIPRPSDTGASGEQASSDIGGDLVVAEPLSELPIAKTIKGLASTNSRQLGGDVASALIAGATSQIAHDLREAKNELSELRKRYDESCRELGESEKRTAVLEERNRIEKGVKHLRNFTIFIGTGLLSASFHLHTISLSPYSYIASVLGALLLVVGWFAGGSKGR